MFDKDRFIERCMEAVGEDPSAMRDIVQEAVSDPAGIMAALGEPGRAGITPLYIAPDLTVIHFVWAPYMSLMPHNHQMFSVVGVYSGREDNVLWRRTPTSIKAAGATSLGSGDFFHPAQSRSEWDHETLTERPWNVDRVKGLFREAEERYAASKEGWR